MWAAVGFVLATLCLVGAALVATLTYIGGGWVVLRSATSSGVGVVQVRSMACAAHLIPHMHGLRDRQPVRVVSKWQLLLPPAPRLAAPRERRTLTPEALQDFQISRKELITPQPSFTEPTPAEPVG